jgi:hypothetical protein
MGLTMKIQLAELGKLAREIVAKRAAVTAAVATAASIATSYHWITPGVSTYANTWVTRGIDLLAVIIGGAWIRSGVTPADPALAPESSTGAALVEATAPDGRPADQR